MKNSALVVVIFMLVAGCERDVEQVVSVPATSAALECATRVAGEHGYLPAQEPAEDGEPRLARPMFGLDGDPPREGPMRDWHLQDYLTITAPGDSLRIAAVGTTASGKALAPSPRTVGHVQGIVAQCATP